ncbi:MAG TPA: NrtA/SsuA/CpmA family ABC transporter substrate-binding protein [Methanotrichaceae archaeon]|nr:NrtA/SsuA/CpmA family ABC transporter substrate-binding protein [Methanotrichaceae archaeon]
MQRNLLAVIAAIALILLAGSGAWYLHNSQKAYAGTPEHITIGIPMMADSSALIFIADNKHFFSDNGLSVTLNVYDAGLYAVNDMLNGKNDLAVATEFVIVGKSLQHEKICTIGSIAKYQTHYLIGRRDRGIEDVSDLKGKKIGFASGTSGEFYLTRFLELHGLSISDVVLVNVKPSQYADAIGNGTVDAILAWDPYTDEIKERLLQDLVIWPAQSGQLGYWNLICRDEWATEHPELISRVLRSVDQAEEYTINHPADAKAVVQKRRNYSDKYMAATWSNTQFSLSLDQSLILAMEDEGRWMIANNSTGEKTIPDYRSYIYTEGLQEIKPYVVNIIE